MVIHVYENSSKEFDITFWVLPDQGQDHGVTLKFLCIYDNTIYLSFGTGFEAYITHICSSYNNIQNCLSCLNDFVIFRVFKVISASSKFQRWVMLGN